MPHTKKKIVLFARVSAEAKAWAEAKAAKTPGLSAGVVVERLLLNDKRKQQARKAAKNEVATNEAA